MAADGLVAGMVEGSLCAFGVGAGLFPNRLEAGDALFQAGGVEIGHAGLDGVEEPVEALVGLGDALVQFGQVLAAALGALLASVENAGEDGSQPPAQGRARTLFPHRMSPDPVLMIALKILRHEDARLADLR